MECARFDLVPSSDSCPLLLLCRRRLRLRLLPNLQVRRRIEAHQQAALRAVDAAATELLQRIGVYESTQLQYNAFNIAAAEQVCWHVRR